MKLINEMSNLQESNLLCIFIIQYTLQHEQVQCNNIKQHKFRPIFNACKTLIQ